MLVVAASPADEGLLRETIARVAEDDPAAASASPHVVTLACAPPTLPIVAGRHALHDPTTSAFAR